MTNDRNYSNRSSAASYETIQPLGTVQAERSWDPQPRLKHTQITNDNPIHIYVHAKLYKQLERINYWIIFRQTRQTWGKWGWKRASSWQTVCGAPENSAPFSPAALWLVHELRLLCVQPGGWVSTFDWYFKAPLLNREASILSHKACRYKGPNLHTSTFIMFNVKP